MSGWTYRTQVVTAGANSQEVRELTAGEVRRFTVDNQGAKDGEEKDDKKGARDEVISTVVAMACINPTRSQEEVDGMPSDLRRACFQTVMTLTGKDEKKETD